MLSDDDLSDESIFVGQIFGCDDLYVEGPGATALLPPDLSALELRYAPAYILPVHEVSVSGVGGIATFLRNVSFAGLPFGDYGRAFWDLGVPLRNLGVSVPQYWTGMVLSAWQGEEGEDGDPNSEGRTLGISTHPDGSTSAHLLLGSTYTGLCAVLRATVAEVPGREKFTVCHELGHTLGLPHNIIEETDPPIDLMDDQGLGQELPFGAPNLNRLRNYNGP